MVDIVLPVPGENPNWGSKLNEAILQINQGLEAFGLRLSTIEGTFGPITVRVTNLEGRVLALETGIASQVEAIVSQILADDTSIREAAEQAAIQAVQSIIAGYFATTANTGLYTFPNAAEPAPPVTQVKYAVDPALISPAVASFHNLPTTTGSGTIRVIASNETPGTWGNSIDPAAQQVTSGTAGVFSVVEVGTSVGTSAARVLSVSSTPGGITGMGVVTAFRMVSGTVAFLRSTIGASGKYAIQRYSGNTLTSGSYSVLSQSSVTARAGDLVELEWISRDGLVVLTVNGAVAALAQLPSAQRGTHNVATLAGVWGHGANFPSNKLGGWQWKERVSTGTVNRRMVSVDSTLTMPADVKLNPTQKRQAVGPRFDIRDYGAKVDGVYLTDARTQAGATYVWSNNYTFTAADVGKRIAVAGAGPVIANSNDGVFMATITGADSGAAVTDVRATTGITGARCVFGTTDDVAIAQAQRDAVRVGGGTVYFPPGRTIVTQPLGVEDFVSWAGFTRDTSWVHVVADRTGNASAAGNCDWLTCAGRDSSNPLRDAHFHDFGVNAEFMIHTEGYGTALKPLNIYQVSRCSIERMNVWNTPATAVPFDHSYDMCVIRDNYIWNPGRLAPSGIGPGGSGIGAGTRASGATEPTLIENNVIRGGHSASVAGAGHNGIFTEAQTGADPDAGVPGYRIVNNVIIGMPIGISDTGSTGTLIEGNQIIGCGVGVRLAKTTLPAAYPGLHTTIANNFIRGCTGPDELDGRGITIYMPDSPADNIRQSLHTLIEGNQIIEGKSWGVSVFAPSGGGYNIIGVVIHGNVIRANGLSGVRLASGSGVSLVQFAVTDNQLVANGRRRITGDRAGILVEPGTTLQGGRIQDNDIYEAATDPTQTDVIVTTGATLTDVRRSGNTGDA